MAPGEAEEEETAGGGKDTSGQPRLPVSPPVPSPTPHRTVDRWADQTASPQRSETQTDNCREMDR